MIAVIHIPEQQEQFERFMPDYKALADQCSTALGVIENGPKNTRTLNVCKELGASYAHTGQREYSPAYARNVALIRASHVEGWAILLDSCVQVLDSHTLNAWLGENSSKQIIANLLPLSDAALVAGFNSSACFISTKAAHRIGYFSRDFCGRWGHLDIDFAGRASYLQIQIESVAGVKFEVQRPPQPPAPIKEAPSKNKLYFTCMRNMAAAADHHDGGFTVNAGDIHKVGWTYSV